MAWIAMYCENGLPSPEAWTAELQGAGLDIEVHPLVARPGDPWDLVPMSVRGNLAPLDMLKAAHRECGWFPKAVPREHPPEARVLKVPRGNAAEWEEAAEWAAVASLQRMGYARLFDPDGRPLEEPSPAAAYERALELMAGLNSRPHPVLGDPSLDYRTQWAREYDQRYEAHGDFDWDGPNELREEMLRNHDEARAEREARERAERRAEEPEARSRQFWMTAGCESEIRRLLDRLTIVPHETVLDPQLGYFQARPDAIYFTGRWKEVWCRSPRRTADELIGDLEKLGRETNWELETARDERGTEPFSFKNLVREANRVTYQDAQLWIGGSVYHPGAGRPIPLAVQILRASAEHYGGIVRTYGPRSADDAVGMLNPADPILAGVEEQRAREWERQAAALQEGRARRGECTCCGRRLSLVARLRGKRQCVGGCPSDAAGLPLPAEPPPTPTTDLPVPSQGSVD